MRKRAVLQALGVTVAVMLLYCLYAASRQVCFDSPCYLPDQIIYFLLDEAWVIGLCVFPIIFLLMLGWQHLTRSRDA